ncbi:MAG: PBP1A family penicillin-binding protein [Vampirovibrio sp.]
MNKRFSSPSLELLVDTYRPAQGGSKSNWGMMLLGFGFVLGTILLFLLSVNVGFVISNSLTKLPDLSRLNEWHPAESTRILDVNGTLIATISGDEDRTVKTLSHISPYLPRAIMAIEDNRFYQHEGVDVKGTARAILSNLKGGEVQGGSTLTQQLIKNLYLSSERSLARKLAEALLAMRIEKLYDKNKILELYLNVVYWGNQAYGAEKAAKCYFNKSAEALSLAEAALLAGLLKAPEGLNPYVYPEAAKARQRLVLEAMQHFGFINALQYEQALNEKLHYDKTPSRHLYPYFVNHVRQEMTTLFGETLVRQGGLQVTTSLDPSAQNAAEFRMRQSFQKAPLTSHLKEGAMIVLNVDDGHILAMVGGRDFNISQFNNATMARRSPGSTFKPFVYLTGFRLGKITPDSIIEDRPIAYNTGYGYWRPKNYDGVFKGRMKIRNALAQSRNTTTIQVGERVGLPAITETARLAGIQSPIAPNFASLLGASGVSVLELATAYSTFARGGTYLAPQAILKIQDSRGKTLYRTPPTPERRLPKQSVQMINAALSTVVKVGTGKKAQLKNREVAGKTGTTDKTRDIWFAGYTRDFVGVLWFGHPQNIPLKGVGSGYCVETWKHFADDYYNTHPLPPRPLEGATAHW